MFIRGWWGSEGGFNGGSGLPFAMREPLSSCWVGVEVRKPEGWVSQGERKDDLWALGLPWSGHAAGLEARGHPPLPPPPASLPFAILTLVNAPYKRGFYCADDSIRYPYRPDTITHGLMAGVTITATIVLVRQEGLARDGVGHGGGQVMPRVVCGEEPPRFPAASRRLAILSPFRWGGPRSTNQRLVGTPTVAAAFVGLGWGGLPGVHRASLFPL